MSGQPSTMHARTFVVDGVWATIGSMNFDNKSLALNDEATLMILDRLVGQQMERIFVDDLSHAEEITLARFRDLAGVGRRDAQLLLERMDVDGLTRRLGDRRVLRRAGCTSEAPTRAPRPSPPPQRPG